MYFSIYECTPDQLDELRAALFWSDEPIPLYDYLDRPVLFPGDITDKTLYRHYAGISFTNDDFCCSMGT